MTNNDVLRRLRYVLDLNDSTMTAIFALAEMTVSREQVSNLLKKDEDPDQQKCNDLEMATFLDGLISYRRGKKEGIQPAAEEKLTNNIILRKLKIAMDFKSDDMLAILELGGSRLSKHELSAFFRKLDHKHHRESKDQVLRNFLQGLQAKYRPESSDGSSIKAN